MQELLSYHRECPTRFSRVRSDGCTSATDAGKVRPHKAKLAVGVRRPPSEALSRH